MTVLRNSTANILAQGVSILVGLYFTPYLIKHLGVTAYGVAPLVMSVFVFAQWISSATTYSVGRYLTIAHVRGETEEVAVIFNTTMVVSLLYNALVVLAGVALSPFASSLLRLPPGTEHATAILIVLGGAATAFNLLSGVTQVSFYCLNRFDLRALITTAGSVGSVALVVAMFGLAGPRLEWVGAGSCAAAGAVTFASYLWGKRLIPVLSFKPRLFSWRHFKMMLGTNVWVVIDGLGVVFLFGVALLLVNRLFGPEVSAVYALAASWEARLKGFMTSLTVFTPKFVSLFGQNDIAGLRAHAQRASRFVGVVTGIVGGVLIGMSGVLPEIWLKRPVEHMGAYMAALMAITVVNAAANPLFGVWQAFNRVRVPCFVTLGTGVLSIALSVLLAKTTLLGPWAVIAGIGTAYTLRNTIFVFQYVARLLGCPATSFYASAASSIGACAIAAAASWALTQAANPAGWIGAGLVAAVSLAVAVPLIAILVLGRPDREAAIAAARSGLRRSVATLAGALR
jgi:membrane protein EpsK